MAFNCINTECSNNCNNIWSCQTKTELFVSHICVSPEAGWENGVRVCAIFTWACSFFIRKSAFIWLDISAAFLTSSDPMLFVSPSSPSVSFPMHPLTCDLQFEQQYVNWHVCCLRIEYTWGHIMCLQCSPFRANSDNKQWWSHSLTGLSSNPNIQAR